MISWQDFYKKYLNKSVDMDSMWGPQCWDLFARYEADNNIPITRCSSSGYVKDIWNDRYKNGVLNYFTEVAPSNIKEGDWVIWPQSYALTRSSHIGMCVGKNQCFGQNQGTNTKVATVIYLDMSKSYGALRIKPKAKLLLENGLFDRKCVLALQKWLGCKEDGYIGSQRSEYNANHPNLLSIEYTTSGNSSTVAALQKKLQSAGYKFDELDGQWGKKTSGYLQQYLTKNGYKVGTDYIFGKKTATQLQKFLNDKVG